MPPPLRPTTARSAARGSLFSSRPKAIAAFIGLAALAGLGSYTYFQAQSADTNLQALPMPTLAPGESPWARVGETMAMTTYWDRSSASREGYIVRVWEIQDMRAPDPDGVTSRQYRAEYDCKHRMHRITMRTACGARGPGTACSRRAWRSTAASCRRCPRGRKRKRRPGGRLSGRSDLPS